MPAFQPLSVHGWTSVFLLDYCRLCGAIERGLRHFLLCWLTLDFQSVISHRRIPWNTPLQLGIEPGSHDMTFVKSV